MTKLWPPSEAFCVRGWSQPFAAAFSRHYIVKRFLVGLVKDMVYQTKDRDITDIHVHHQITEATSTTTEDMLARIWPEIEQRLDVVRATESANLEVH